MRPSLVFRPLALPTIVSQTVLLSFGLELAASSQSSSPGVPLSSRVSPPASSTLHAMVSADATPGAGSGGTERDAN